MTVKERPIYYNGQPIIRFDDVPFEDGDRFKFTFESKNSNWRQGVLLSVLGYFEYNGEKWPDRILFWEDNSPREIVVTVYKERKKRKQPKRLPAKGLLGIKNVWDCGGGRIDSWFGGHAMIVEEIENGKRYKCNDGHPDENFDDIVFKVERIGCTERDSKIGEK